MASIISQLPANYLENALVTNPTMASFIIGGISYTRAQVLTYFNSVADSSENTVPVVGLQAIPGAPMTTVRRRADVS